jgi:hypothetical protein
MRTTSSRPTKPARVERFHVLASAANSSHKFAGPVFFRPTFVVFLAR